MIKVMEKGLMSTKIRFAGTELGLTWEQSGELSSLGTGFQVLPGTCTGKLVSIDVFRALATDFFHLWIDGSPYGPNT